MDTPSIHTEFITNVQDRNSIHWLSGRALDTAQTFSPMTPV
jgi:hypothetical protein